MGEATRRAVAGGARRRVAQRAWAPAPMGAGQRAVWQLLVREWPRETVTRAGTVWSQGPSASAWWVVPDGEGAGVVLVRRAGKRGAARGWQAGDLVEDAGAAAAAAAGVARAERVRAAGLVAVVERVIPGHAGDGYRAPAPDTACVRWHADPACPAAAGRPVHAGGYARGWYRGAVDGPWTAGAVAAWLAGVLAVRAGDEPPVCAECVLGAGAQG